MKLIADRCDLCSRAAVCGRPVLRKHPRAVVVEAVCALDNRSESGLEGSRILPAVQLGAGAAYQNWVVAAPLGDRVRYIANCWLSADECGNEQRGGRDNG